MRIVALVGWSRRLAWTSGPAVVATCLAALLTEVPLGAQDTTRSRIFTPTIERALPAGALPQRVLRVDPDVLGRMTRDTAAIEPDTTTYVASRVGDTAVRAAPDQVLQADRLSYVLPYRVLANTGSRTSGAEPGGNSTGELPAGGPGSGSGTGGDTPGRSYLRPVIQVAGDGLSFAGSDEGFRGILYLGVQDSLRPGSSIALAEPIHFLLDVAGGAVEPARIAVGHTNLPFEEVAVLTLETRDSVTLRVRSSVLGEAIPLTLPVSRPSLSVIATPAAVSGLGIETTMLIAQTNRIGPGRTRVTFQSTMGRPDPAEAVIGPDGTARTTLRSSGLGATEVQVHSPGFRSASTQVRFTFPIAFLLAALFGGIAGGAARHFRGSRTSEEGSLPGSAGIGVIFGSIVAVAYAVGVNLLGVELGAEYGEALVFTLAALGGYFRIPATGERAAPSAG